MIQSQHLKYLSIPSFEKIPFLCHGFGTKFFKEEDFKKIPEWRNFRLVFLDQIHSDIVHCIEEFPSNELKGDALLTNKPFLFLILETADCLPVLMIDEFKRAVAAVHCGWRGTSKRVIQKAVKKLEEHYACKPSSLLVAMGPSIGNNCYEVGEDVRRSFEKEALSMDAFQSKPLYKGKYALDLKKSNSLQLMDLGVNRKNIFSINSCTHCSKHLSSYRRDRKKAGRMLSFIGLSF